MTTIAVIVRSSAICERVRMRERLWVLNRGKEVAVAMLTDLGLNGFEVEIVVAEVVASVDRFTTRALAVHHAEDERHRLQGDGWR